MADTFTELNLGTGGSKMDESALTVSGTPVHRTRVVIGDDTSATGLAAVKAASTAAAAIDPALAVTLSPNGNQATAAAQATGNASVASIDGKTPALGQATMAGSVPVALASNQPPIAIDISGPGTLALSQYQTDGTQKTQVVSSGGFELAIDGSGIASVTDQGTLFALAALTDGTQATRLLDPTGTVYVDVVGTALKVDGSAVTQPISAASLPLPALAATSALQTQPGVDIGDVTVNNAGGASAVPIQDGGNSITVDGTVAVTGVATAAAQTDKSQFTKLTDGTTDPVAVKAASTAAVATDKALVVTQSPNAPTTGNSLPFHLVSAGTTNATNVKASAGVLKAWTIGNNNASQRYVKFHNSAGTPTAGSGVVWVVEVPGNTAGGVSNGTCGPHGLPFATGIAITTVTGMADSDATAVTVNDLNINLVYA